MLLRCLFMKSNITAAGGREGLKGNSPTLLYEVTFVNRPKTLRKIWGLWENDVTKHSQISASISFAYDEYLSEKDEFLPPFCL